jgi:hypothetical protein
VPLHVPLLVNSLPSVAVSVAADAPWDVILVGVMVAGNCPAVALPLRFENAGCAQLLLPVVHPCDQLFPEHAAAVLAVAAVPSVGQVPGAPEIAVWK